MDARKVMKRTGNQPMSCTVEMAPGGWRLEHAEDEVADDEDDRGGDDLIEGVLQEASEPAPEKPLEFRDDEKRHEDRAHEHAHGGGDETVGDDHDGDGLSRGQQNNDDHVDDSAEMSVTPGASMRASKSFTPWSDGLEFGLVDPARQGTAIHR